MPQRRRRRADTHALAQERDTIDTELAARPALPPLLHSRLRQRRQAITSLIDSTQAQLMVNNIQIPTEEFVRSQLDELRQRTGRTPSILALATRLRLSNNTFRRHFPDVRTELRARDRPRDPISGVDAYDTLRAEYQKLTARNRDLASDLELAIAQIQRLTLDNDQLTRELHDARRITDLSSRRSSSPPHL